MCGAHVKASLCCHIQCFAAILQAVIAVSVLLSYLTLVVLKNVVDKACTGTYREIS